MSQVQTAAALLVGAVVMSVLALIWLRRARARAKPHTISGLPPEPKGPLVSRRAREEEEPIEMAPARLARIGRNRPADGASDEMAGETAGAAPHEPASALPESGPDGESFDIADPAHHPKDWDMMLAMAEILETHLAQSEADAGGGGNGDARARAREIIAIVRESAGQHDFAAADAAAVMAGLQAISWTGEASGEDMVETHTLPLTRHRPGAGFWVDDYRRLWLARTDAARGTLVDRDAAELSD